MLNKFFTRNFYDELHARSFKSPKKLIVQRLKNVLETING